MNSNKNTDKRHVSGENFERLLASPAPLVLPIHGSPDAVIFIEPVKRELGLRVPVDGRTDTPTTGSRNITTRTTDLDGQRHLEVVVTSPALFRDAYPVLCSMADRVQLEGMSPAAALRATLDMLSALLRSPETMSREVEVGLIGELIVAAGLIDQLGVEDAVQAWRGGRREEHDFGLPDCDVEVKTTTSERRIHWIESLTQLVPTMNRPLWLVSHQLTSAGSTGGRTLGNLVSLLRSKIGHGAAREAFEAELLSTGWRDEHDERLRTRWTRRFPTTAYQVDGSFPRLTPDTLHQAETALDRIADVRYRVDLHDFHKDDHVPTIITAAVRFEG